MDLGDNRAVEFDVSPDAVRRQLATLLGSQAFASSPRLSRFLRYIVEQTLNSASENIKEYSIGVEVFDRGESFDPRTDTIVRVQARRLRDRLADYYAGEGRTDTIVIEVPKGGYVPEFRRPPLPQTATEAAVRTFPQPSRREPDASPKPALVKTLARHGETLVLPARHFEHWGSRDLGLAGTPGIKAADRSIHVGRDKELASLHAAFQQVRSGQSLLVGAAGEAGIGKTTLLEVFLHQIAVSEQVCSIERGQCSERLAGTEAYLPFFDVLEDLLQQDWQIHELMRERAPWWYAKVASLSADSPTGARILERVKSATQERVKRELASFLQELSRPRPLVLFIEDLHWADVSTIDMLAYLGAKFETMRLLILTAYRPTEMAHTGHPFLRIKTDLLSRGRCREMELRFLSEGDVRHYLTLKYPGHEFPGSFAKLIHLRTEGSPLFMVDLVRDLEDRDMIIHAPYRWRLAHSISEIKFGLPDSVKGMIQRKISQLCERDHELLAAASVQGFAFDSAVLAQVLALDEEAVEERLQALETEHRFVQLMDEGAFPDRSPTLRYRFVHVLYQNELYASLTRARRARLSRAAAEALEGFYGERSGEVASELASLYETARDFSKAVDYFGGAAENAVGVFAFQEAVVLAQRGLELLGALPVTLTRDKQELSLQVTLGASLTATRGYGHKGVGVAYTRVRELAKKFRAEPRAVAATIGLSRYYRVTMQLRNELELCRELLQLGQREKDSALLSGAHVGFGIAEQFLGNFARSSRHLEQVLELHRTQRIESAASISGEDAVVSTLGHQAWNVWILGFPDQAIRPSAEARARAEETRNPFVLAHYFGFAGFLYQGRGDLDKVLEVGEEHVRVSEENAYDLNMAWGAMQQGWVWAERGRCEKGLAIMHQGLATWRAVGMVVFVPYWHALLAEIYGKIGQPERGLDLVEESLTVIEKDLHRMWIAELHRIKGELLLLQGAAASEVEACYQKALEIARRQKAKSIELRAATSLTRLWQTQGRHEEARELLSGVYGWFTEGFDTHDLRVAKGLLEVQ